MLPTYFDVVTTIENNRQVRVNIDVTLVAIFRIDIYNFIHAKQNDIGGAVLIWIGGNHALMSALGPPTQLIAKILGRCKYLRLKDECTVWIEFLF